MSYVAGPPSGEGKPFAGFPPRAQAVAIPSLFFSAVLPQLQDMAELRVSLCLFWRLGEVRGYPRFVTYEQMAADPVLGAGLDPAAISAALKQAVARGTLLTLTVEQGEVRHQLYFINDQSSRRAVDRIARGELSLEKRLPGGGSLALPRPTSAALPAAQANIFSLYEQNIGLLTPLLTEELAEAERSYPASWIEEAFREAAHLNKRNWRYISRILERWATEGKDHGEVRRYPEAVRPPWAAKGKAPSHPEGARSGRPRHPLWG